MLYSSEDQKKRGATLDQPPAPPKRHGIFITLEGGEGSGKTTQAALLAEHLRADKRLVLVTREPGATEVGLALRALLLDGKVSIGARTEALLFAADRAQHVESVIAPALAAGVIVICDRHRDSSIAYQAAARGLDPEAVAGLSDFATGGLIPDLTLLLDVSTMLGLARAGARAGEVAMQVYVDVITEFIADHAAQTGVPERLLGGRDRFEREPDDFHQRVRSGLLRLAAVDNTGRYRLFDASQPTDIVARMIAGDVGDFLDHRGYTLRADGCTPTGPLLTDLPSAPVYTLGGASSTTQACTAEGGDHA